MRVGGLLFVGLDVETTGSDIMDGAGLCQVGVYTPDAAFSSDVKVRENVSITEEALKVNGFTRERLVAGPHEVEVDGTLGRFLEDLHPRGRRSIIPIGWNVAGFDMQFMRKFLWASTKQRFSYRSVDLNAVCFTLDPKNWKDWKRAAKQYAEDVLSTLGFTLKPHDALYDAAQAYYAWEYLRFKLEKQEARH